MTGLLTARAVSWSDESLPACAGHGETPAAGNGQTGWARRDSACAGSAGDLPYNPRSVARSVICWYMGCVAEANIRVEWNRKPLRSVSQGRSRVR